MRFQGILALCLVSLLVVSGFGVISGSSKEASGRIVEDESISFAGGNGTESDPYEISNVTQLQNMNENLSAHYELVSDIDASATQSWNNGSGFVPVANDTSSASGFQGTNFNGSLDGQGYEISDLYLNRSSSDYVGLFGYTTSGASIHDVGLVDVDVSGDWHIGGLVGGNEGTVSNSYATGDMSGCVFVGGLVGMNYDGTVNNSYVARNVSGDEYVGGLVGINSGTVNSSYATGNVSGNAWIGGLIGGNGGTVSNSYATENVSGTDNWVGGLVGSNDGTVNNSYATGNVSGDEDVGGLVGINSGTVTNSYATGNVSGNDQVGGLVGRNEGTVSNSYATGNVSGEGWGAGGLVGWNHGTVYKSYAIGNVSGNSDVGGLVGLNDGPIRNSFWDVNTTGQSSSAGGTGKTTAEMKDIETFTDNYTEGLISSWDFEDTWWIIGDSTYPRLKNHSTPPASMPPNEPVNVHPKDERINVNNPPNLSVRVYHPNEDSMDVTFYDENGTQIGSTQTSIPHGGTASVVWDDLLYESNYTWYAVTDDGDNTTTSSNWTFETELDPNAPFDPRPQDGAINVQTSANLSVQVVDPEGDEMDVRFYNASNDSLIGEDKNISSGENASVNWDGLNRYTTYGWYAIADDGMNSTRSPTWNFTTLPFIGGNGTENNPYLIENVTQLQYMNKNLTAHYRLANDIDASMTSGWNAGSGFNPVGDSSDNFTGTLDGQDHKIMDLYIDRPSSDNVGLFGYLGENTSVKDLGLVDLNINGSNNVGGIAGTNNGTVTGTHSTGTVSGQDYSGLLIGWNAGIISNSYATGSVSGDGRVGGLVGANGGRVNNSYATGNVSGNEDVGGLVGRNEGTINNSYATGNVSGDGYYIGGLVGWNYGGKVNNSYATGNVSGNEDVGGLVGVNGGRVNNSHYNIDEVLINGGNHITTGGLFDAQYQDWISSGKTLDISDYSDTLVPSGEYYEISGVEGIKDLLGFADDKEYKFRLGADIDLSGEPGLYIPYLAADFEGAGHKIQDLNLNWSSVRGYGLFGYLHGSALVEDMDVVDVNVSGNNCVGGLVGSNYGTVRNSYAVGNVSGNGYISGGLVGWNHGTVSNSYATGNVSGYRELGGLVGGNSGAINNSYADGNVSGNEMVGGLAGINWDGVIKNSYSTGAVSGDFSVGGLVGIEHDGTVSNSFWDVNTTGQSSSAGGTGKTTAQMKDIDTFTNESTAGLQEAWDFVGNPNNDTSNEDIWDIDENGTVNDGYPYLTLEDDSNNTPPTADAGENITAYQGSTVTLDGSNSTDDEGITNYTWMIDKEEYYGEVIQYTFTEPGTYTVTLNVTDTSGAYDTDQCVVTIDPDPDPQVNIQSPSEGEGIPEPDLTIDWNGSDEGSGLDHYELYINGDLEYSGTGTSYTREFTSGNYKAVVVAFDQAGNNASDTVNFTVDLAPPNAEAGDDQMVYVYKEVELNGSGSSDNVGIVNYTWSVDGEEYYGEVVTLTFEDAGTYDVQLEVFDTCGSDTDTCTIEVQPDNSPPYADAGPDRDVVEDTVVTFNGSESSDNLGIANYTWTIEDESYYGMIVNHTFHDPGSYEVSLEVRDHAGNENVATCTVDVEDVTAPEAEAGNDLTVTVAENFTLSAANSSDNGVIDEYIWQIEGEEKTGIDIVHSFSEPGTKNITLKVIDGGGNNDTDKVYITVVDETPPTAVAKGNRTTVQEGLPVKFSGSSSTDNVEVTNYTWEFGDGSSSEGEKTTHIFDSPGDYTVTLTVNDASGNEDSDTLNITVEEEPDTEPPNAEAGDNKTVYVGENFTLDASSSTDNEGIVNYTWIIQEKECSGREITLNLTSEGNYTITLRVSDEAGNTANDTVNVTVEKEEIDTDGDGEPDSEDPDDDGDGLPDDWEERYDLDPKYPGDADGDLDGDGFTNFQEYSNGTDPTLSGSHPEKQGGGSKDKGPGLWMYILPVMMIVIAMVGVAYWRFGEDILPYGEEVIPFGVGEEEEDEEEQEELKVIEKKEKPEEEASSEELEEDEASFLEDVEIDETEEESKLEEQDDTVEEETTEEQDDTVEEETTEEISEDTEENGSEESSEGTEEAEDKGSEQQEETEDEEETLEDMRSAEIIEDLFEESEE